MDPYLSNPDDIPASDPHADVVSYGRYLPTPDDFRVLPTHVNSPSAESLRYLNWADVLALCDKSNRICPGIDGGRDVFALGSVIVKSNHRLDADDGQPHSAGIGYSYADANEVQAIGLKLNTLNSRARIGGREAEMLFSDTNTDDQDMNFMHNDFSQSNIIVDNDRIVGVIDWEMAGFFGWKTAGEVHRLIRTTQREHFANVNLTGERLQEIMIWNDLYEDGRQ